MRDNGPWLALIFLMSSLWMPTFGCHMGNITSELKKLRVAVESRNAQSVTSTPVSPEQPERGPGK